MVCKLVQIIYTHKKNACVTDKYMETGYLFTGLLISWSAVEIFSNAAIFVVRREAPGLL